MELISTASDMITSEPPRHDSLHAYRDAAQDRNSIRRDCLYRRYYTASIQASKHRHEHNGFTKQFIVHVPRDPQPKSHPNHAPPRNRNEKTKKMVMNERMKTFLSRTKVLLNGPPFAGVRFDPVVRGTAANTHPTGECGSAAQGQKKG